LSLLIIKISAESYCDFKESQRIYNINRNIYIDTGNNSIYNMDTNQMSESRYKLEDIYGESMTSFNLFQFF
jgi:hypothetical protein